MTEDIRLSGLNEKLRYLKEEVEAVHKNDVLARRKAALNVGTWIYAIEQSARRLKDLDRSRFETKIQPLIDTFCNNPIIDWWLVIRHKVTHDLPPSFVSSTHVSHLDSSTIDRINRSAPTGTKGMFIGDELGGSGWEVEGEGGEVRKVYFSLPNAIGSTEINFPDPPNTKKIEDLASEAFSLTNKLVEDVKAWVNGL
jgi:hypothetical protein